MVAALIGSLWARVGIIATGVAVGFAIASIVWHRRHILGYDEREGTGSAH
jgi:hypothetical protein